MNEYWFYILICCYISTCVYIYILYCIWIYILLYMIFILYVQYVLYVCMYVCMYVVLYVQYDVCMYVCMYVLLNSMYVSNMMFKYWTKRSNRLIRSARRSDLQVSLLIIMSVLLYSNTITVHSTYVLKYSHIYL